ncbi:MAG: glycosyltransferase family A protein [Humibacillus sp.]
MAPRVSIVVPTYNNVDFVEATIASILAQTFTDFELVIADHSSTDGTWEVVNRFADDPRVTLLRTPAGGGAPANWTRVTDAGHGTYVKLVCGDDLLEPTCLHEQVAVLDEHPDVVLTSCRRTLVDARGERFTAARGLAGLVGVTPGRVAARRAVISGTNIFGEPACVLMRRDAFDRAGGWADTEPYVIDQQTFCNVLMHGDFYAMPKALASFRLSVGQWSVNLAQTQSAQVVRFHHRLAELNPGLLSRADLVRGDALARGMAYVRRGAYLWLGRKMHPEEQVAPLDHSAR